MFNHMIKGLLILIAVPLAGYLSSLWIFNSANGDRTPASIAALIPGLYSFKSSAFTPSITLDPENFSAIFIPTPLISKT